MIISENSYLRLPPRKLNAEQTVIFNAITYSVDISELSYNRLYPKLINLSDNPNPSKLIFAELFSDAWSIINSGTIFLNLVTRHFKTINNSKLIELRKAKKLRNSNQHLDERITEIYSSKNLPIYGSLSWIHNFTESTDCILAHLSAGVFTHHDSFQASFVPKGNGDEEIENLTLCATVKEKNDFVELGVSLKSIIDEMEEYTSRIEAIFTKQIEALESTNEVERHGANMLLMFKAVRFKVE